MTDWTDDDIEAYVDDEVVVVQIGAMHAQRVGPEDARKWADDLEHDMPDGSETPDRLRELADEAEP